VERGFCASCGTQVCDHYLKGVDHVFATIGSLEHFPIIPDHIRQRQSSFGIQLA
jgi:hypothetical protein